MLRQFKSLLSLLPEFELCDFYCYLYGEIGCSLCKCDYENHIYSFYRMYLHYHKKEKDMIVKAHIMNSWYEYMKDKYRKEVK